MKSKLKILWKSSLICFFGFVFLCDGMNSEGLETEDTTSAGATIPEAPPLPGKKIIRGNGSKATAGFPRADRRKAQKPIQSLQPRRLVMLVDKYGCENPDESDSKNALAMDLINIIKQACCVALVDKNVLRKFLTFLPEARCFTLSRWRVCNIRETSFYMLLPNGKSSLHLRGFPVYDDLEELTDFLGRKISFANAIYRDFLERGPASSFRLSDLEALEKFVERSYKYKPDFDSTQLAHIFCTNDHLKRIVSTDIIHPNADKLEDPHYNLVHRYFRPWEIFLTGHGSDSSSSEIIAGMDGNDFKAVLKFFNDLNTKFMYVSSCYAGGEKAERIAKWIEGTQTLRYPLAFASIMESKIMKLLYADKSNDFEVFFSVLEGERETYSDWIKEVLSYLSLESNWFFYQKGIGAIPQVLMPRVGRFSAIGVDPSILILNKVQAEKGRKEGALDIYGKLGVVVDPDIVYPCLQVYPCHFPKKSFRPEWIDLFKGLPLWQDREAPNKCHYYPIFVPRKAVVSRPTFYFFEKIELSCPPLVGLFHFIRNSLLNTQGRESMCCFLIKELVGICDLRFLELHSKPATFQNVFVATKERRIWNGNKEVGVVDLTVSFCMGNDKFRLQLAYEQGSYLPGRWDFKKLKPTKAFDKAWTARAEEKSSGAEENTLERCGILYNEEMLGTGDDSDEYIPEPVEATEETIKLDNEIIATSKSQATKPLASGDNYDEDRPEPVKAKRAPITPVEATEEAIKWDDESIATSETLQSLSEK